MHRPFVLRVARVVALVAAFGLGTSASAQEPADPLFDDIARQAKALAQEPHAPPEAALPQGLRDLSYDQYRDIRFRKDHALWRDETLFEVQLFHLGFLYRAPVTINLVEDGVPRRLAYDPAMFDFGDNSLDEAPPEDLGFAGFRLHYPLNEPSYKDEVAVFLGASYFRVIGRGQIYGLSARGLAIDTALDDGEEFPMFREFWLVEPGPQDTTLTVYALLDSESVTGAYRFDIRPGADTVVDVDATLFARADIRRLGIAPLTSMFLFGEARLRQFDDFRPEVHDSDGLLMRTGGDEWIWRPLDNPRQLRVTTLSDRDPKGFGLLQRDRDFDHYLDLESHYERRPSAWIEPRGDWGPGAVHLVQIPSEEEINDNIVAFWVAEQPLEAGQSRRFAYRLRATGDPVLPRRALAHAVRSQIGWAATPGAEDKPPRRLRRFVIDFEGGQLDGLRREQPVEAKLEASTGEISEVTATPLPGGGWRASFRLMPEGDQPADLRLHLSLRGERVSETWSYVWAPDVIQ